MSTLEKVLSRVIPVTESGCWLWEGCTNPRYGQMMIDGKLKVVHRYVYEQLKGPIPEGFELDHLCRVHRCCNPDHLEIVMHRTNILRGVSPSARHAVKTHCPSGHPYSGHNLIYNRANGKLRRICRICHDADRRARKARQKAEGRQIKHVIHQTVSQN